MRFWFGLICTWRTQVRHCAEAVRTGMNDFVLAALAGATPALTFIETLNCPTCGDCETVNNRVAKSELGKQHAAKRTADSPHVPMIPTEAF